MSMSLYAIFWGIAIFFGLFFWFDYIRRLERWHKENYELLELLIDVLKKSKFINHFHPVSKSMGEAKRKETEQRWWLDEPSQSVTDTDTVGRDGRSSVSED